ncbi:MAG TPA: trehalose-phosphatase [Actinomycetota bacterium]|jgi:trehalose 6-phosphate phosphatase
MDLQDLAALRDRAAVLVDFDGTLSEIAPTPEEARPVAGAVEALEALGGRFAVVAVVSGRPAAQVAALTGGRVRCFGLYGLEDTEGGGPVPALPDRLLARVREAAAGIEGTRVELKGSHVALHYRGAEDPDGAGRALREALGPVAEREGLRMLEGKRVLELAPAGGPTKGDVIRRVARENGLRAVLYAGDDVADLEAFDAVEALAGEGVAAFPVAVRTEETPLELLERAGLVVEGPAGLVALLGSLA